MTEKKPVKHKPKRKTRTDPVSGPSKRDYLLPGPCKEPAQDMREAMPSTEGRGNPVEVSGMEIGPNDGELGMDQKVTTTPGRSGLGSGHSSDEIEQSQDHKEAAPPAGNEMEVDEGSGMDIDQ